MRSEGKNVAMIKNSPRVRRWGWEAADVHSLQACVNKSKKKYIYKYISEYVVCMCVLHLRVKSNVHIEIDFSPAWSRMIRTILKLSSPVA